MWPVPQDNKMVNEEKLLFIDIPAKKDKEEMIELNYQSFVTIHELMDLVGHHQCY